jgi:aspartyl-tRNA(Asn)/glutamyl-tRNA(Gln) amidotransferase subunit B
LAQLLGLVEAGSITTAAAKAVFEEMFETGRPAQEIVEERGLAQISDSQEVAKAVKEAIAGNAKAVADFAAGKEQALKFLVGQVMRLTKGRANPQLVTELLKKELSGKGV